MKMRAPTLCLIAVLVANLVILPASPLVKVPAAAAPSVVQAQQMKLPPGTLRTVDEMLVDQATAAFPSSPGGEVVFRPGGDPAEYAAAKTAAAAAPQGRRPASPAGPSGAVAVSTMNCDGSDQTTSADVGGGQWFPPDADGAVGVSQFVQVTNMHVTVWEKAAIGGCPASGVPLLDVDLQTLMGYLPPTYPNAIQLFDPRVVHDDLSGRWVITAPGFPERDDTGGTPQIQFIAVSQSEDATGDYFIYSFNARTLENCSPGDFICFWDYPQVGYDGTAIILTANVFRRPLRLSHTRLIFINKSDLYAGFGPVICSFTSGLFSWAPPKVVGGSTFTWLAEAPPPPRAASLNLFKFSSTGAVCPRFEGVFAVDVPAYGVPPNASQPGTAIKLDTLDARFQNRSAQVGDGYLWQTHTTNDAGLPTPRLYRIRLTGAGSPVVEQTIDYFASRFSHDFNPSIAANAANTVAVTWSSTDAGFGVNAQVRVGAKTFTAIAVSQALVFQSTVPLVGNGSDRARWGDYSSTAIDPTNPGVAWGVNEEIDNPDDPTGGSWGTRFFNATIP